MKRIVLATVLVLLALFASPAFAAAPVPIQWIDPNTGAIISVSATTATALPVQDANPDRKYPRLQNVFSGVVLNSSVTFQAANPIDISQYSRAVLMLTWGTQAAADSDSTVILVRIYGKTSPSSGNLHLWTPYTNLHYAASGDTCFCNALPADSAGAATKCIVPPPTFVVGRQVYPQFLGNGTTKVTMGVMGGTTATRGTLRKVPSWSWRMAGANSAMLNLSDDAGNPCPFPYIFVEITNLSFNRNLTNVEANIWPRVN